MGKADREKSHEEAKLESRISFFTFAGWLLVGVGSVFFGYGIINANNLTLNEVGDFVSGTVGSLWALAGLFFIYVAFLGQKVEMLYQREELGLTREELSATREELKGQREQMAIQNENLRKQNFENTFFQLVHLHNEIISGITSGDKQGRECFKIFYEHINGGYNREKAKNDFSFKKFFWQYYRGFESRLNHYFENLYRIFEFLDVSTIRDKELYINLALAQISSFELLLLFYYCKFYEKEEFVRLIEKYQLFKNLIPAELFSGEHSTMYESKAYHL